MKVNIAGATVSGQVNITSQKDGSVGCNLIALNGQSCNFTGITGDDTAAITIENKSGTFTGYSDDDNVCNDSLKSCSIKRTPIKQLP